MKQAIKIVTLLLTLGCVLTPNLTFGVSSIIFRVSESDPIFKSLSNYQAKVEADCEKEHLSRPTFYKWGHGTTNSLPKLFPNLRFAWMFWSETPIANSKERSPESTKDLEVTLVIDTATGAIVAELHESGDQAAFGKLLVSNSISLKNEADAKLIWNAFCETHLHFLGGEYEPSTKVSDNEWHLGNYRYYQIISDANGVKKEMCQTCYLKVIVDPETHNVISCRSIVVDSKEFTGGMIKYSY